jgi:PIN domain nuclease of toxin-antitoxin system
MSLLLDTCTFLWIALDPPKVSKAATQLFQDPANVCYLSSISAWEIAVKYRLGRLLLASPPETFVPIQRANHRILELPVAEAASAREHHLAAIHKDPFDRLLVCQAIHHGLVLLTPDPLIQQYPVTTAW